MIDNDWWLNIKIDGTGAFLYDLKSDPNLERNVADLHHNEVKRLYQLGVDDAKGSFPEYLMELCAKHADAPGCSSLVARE